MTQHDLFRNPSPQRRAAYPLVVNLQADVAVGDRRITAPLAARGATLAATPNHALPVVNHDGQAYVVMLPLIGTLPVSLLKEAVGSLAGYRDDLTRALDWLLWGI